MITKTTTWDAVLIGAGHNGLTCACYLASAGLKVLMLEAREVVGGAAVTHEFHPGFRNSRLSYTVSLLQPKIIRDLRLAQHGLRVVERPFSNFLPLSESSYFRLGPDLASTQQELAKFGPAGVRDAQALPAYYAMLDRAAAVLKSWLLKAPPNLGDGLAFFLDSVKLGRGIAPLSLDEKRDLLDLFTKSAGEILDARFETPALKAAFGFDAVVGNFASPYSAGSAYVLLHHVFGEVNGKSGAWGHAIGGMGAITQAMRKETEARGVTIRCNAPVAQVCVKAGRAVGVVLRDGEEVSAKVVIGNVHPQRLFGQMLAKSAWDGVLQGDDFSKRIARYQSGSGTLRMNLALNDLPRFTCLPDAGPHLSAGIIMAPSLDYMERAFFSAKTGRWSVEPIVEMLIPSTVDDSLCPPGKHVASLFCQHVNPVLPQGQTWDQHRDTLADLMMATVDRYAPGFAQSVLARDVLTPLDLERDYGLVGGDIFHGRLSLDQLFSARPVLGQAAYRAPIQALYLCGSGAHPGGGVTGAPGHNCAQMVLRDKNFRIGQ